MVDENMQARRSTWVTPDQEMLPHIISSIILSNSNILLLSRKKYSSTSSFISAVARFIYDGEGQHNRRKANKTMTLENLCDMDEVQSWDL